ncbi:NAD-P-binding protein [Cristinia sonorae]|uniref:NAD-P-binding protein n=1 Tax=Cristinia sonorae TaxID=1940300 RepID=A0A8K0UNN1_9AGAR|nr:NAD-P-binding protein [Cristinia sonorae]
MSQKGLVLVTGASGYLGAHVVDQLVKEGYRARGTVRSGKLSASRDAFSVYGDAVEIVPLDDLAGGDFTDVLQGVNAVIHVAAPMTEPNVERALEVAVDGSLNVLRQAEKAGITNFAYVSSIVAVTTRFLFGDYSPLSDNENSMKEWSPITKEEILNKKDADVFTIYIAEKVLSEKAVWEFAEQHPHIELTTVNPPFFYGPFAPGHRGPHEIGNVSVASMSSMNLFWNLLDATGSAVPYPQLVDVRDVARSLVAALTAPPTSKVGRKRILVSGEWVNQSEILKLVEKERPELLGRISKAVKEDKSTVVKSVVDQKRVREVLGIEVRPWQETVLDAIDALIDLEKEWKGRGVTLARA